MWQNSARLCFLVMVAFTSGCSFVSKKTDITYMENTHGTDCGDVSVRKTVLFDVVSGGPPLLPIVPAFLVKTPIFNLSVFECNNNARYPVEYSDGERYWLDVTTNCKYRIEIDTEYEYEPFWLGGKSEEGPECFSMSEINHER